MTPLEAISPTARGLLATETPREDTRPTVMALSIKQPWAWLIAHGYKDVENRDWPTKFRGDFMVHAGATMTKDDYAACTYFIAGFTRRWRLPAYDVLRKECGGIVGSARLTACVAFWRSHWFTGEYGFVLEDAKPLPFQPCKGKLGFFKVTL